MSSTQGRAGRHDNRTRVAAPAGAPAHDQETGGNRLPTAGGVAADPPVWWDECLNALDFYGGPLGCVWEPPSPPVAVADEEVDEPEEVEDEEDEDEEDEEDEDEAVDEEEDDEEDEDDLDEEEDAEEDEELEAQGEER